MESLTTMTEVATQEEKETKDRWSDCKQIFFHHGQGYVVDSNLQTICLGKEEDIKAALISGQIKEGLLPRARDLLRSIIENREIKQDGDTTSSRPRGIQRTRPAKSTRNRQKNTRRFKARQRVPIH